LAEGIVVTSPRLPKPVEALGPGIGFWLYRELAVAGVALRDTETLPVIPHGASKPREAWELVAQRAGASHLLLTEADLELGQLRLRLALVERGGAVVAGAEREGAFAELGTLLRDATIAILDQIELPIGELAGDPGPRLSEIAAFSRALEHLRGGEFTAAHKELSRRRTPAADALRRRIARASSAKGVPLASRARLAIAQGDVDRSWLRLRNELRERDDPELLVAAGDAAASIPTTRMPTSGRLPPRPSSATRRPPAEPTSEQPSSFLVIPDRWRHSLAFPTPPRSRARSCCCGPARSREPGSRPTAPRARSPRLPTSILPSRRRRRAVSATFSSW
jgi:hypothetical protein